ncbi:mitochondrial inner membrane protein Mpv17-like [Rhynchophorus ferrugineus]|uniref:Mitochondrial inner membrane protein Mpv17 n=1 Tax=Rhynchophorus ferrugineus TaxID=354439 RepID=A0A834HX03_RHYFE|nr:hypothetical protein GWI33_018463 [Rhynchophorus ferrugineus]
MLRAYQKLLDKHFLLVQCVQTGSMMAVGDVVAQTLIEKKQNKEFEPMRTVKFGLLGVCFVGPTLTVWYRILAKYLGKSGSSSGALKKVAIDQIVFLPTFLAVFIANVNLMNGKNMRDLKQEMVKTYPDVVINSWKIWPAVQLINFYWVPRHYQVLLVQTVALFWNPYLSWKTQKVH